MFDNRHQNEIEAFLVSVGVRTTAQPSEQYSQGTEASAAQASSSNVTGNNTTEARNTSSPTLPLESANSFANSLGASSSVLENDTSSAENSVKVETFNNPFPGCNLSKEVQKRHLINFLIFCTEY